MKRLMVLVFTLASLASAETVYMSEHGKSFHTHRECIGLRRSKSVLTADDKEARAHGMALCGICAHRKSGKAAVAGKAWAKAEGK